jgi:hypothetical protein
MREVKYFYPSERNAAMQSKKNVEKPYAKNIVYNHESKTRQQKARPTIWLAFAVPYAGILESPEEHRCTSAGPRPKRVSVVLPTASSWGGFAPVV